jgi:hypothetical protein
MLISVVTTNESNPKRIDHRVSVLLVLSSEDVQVVVPSHLLEKLFKMRSFAQVEGLLCARVVAGYYFSYDTSR